MAAKSKRGPISSSLGLTPLADQWRVVNPGPEDRACLSLARAIHRAESKEFCTSWSAQERAHAFITEHGLARALDEITRLGGEL